MTNLLRRVLGLGAVLLVGAAASPRARAATWFPLGPYGGDARSFAADPHDSRHLYLGTATGWIYQSRDGGASWTRLAQVAHRDDLIIDHILADPKSPQRLIVGAYFVDRPEGGLYLSEDGGKSWYAQAEVRGQSVRSLARSTSNPDIIVAGTLRGVFRSNDDGKHWQAISPEGSTEIHEVESIAIDPSDPDIIYAGTWHLPWKTTDGGAHWKNIKDGIIDDSDVFSILVDPKKPQIVYASACSGIYKSTDGADLFRKVQGIPSTARRTRKLAQDPEHLDTVYAGTTEGLYKTTDGGAQWARLTGPEIIVNDVYVDPADSNHVLIATDRGGVYSSGDAGVTFAASNTGFSARQVAAYAADATHPSTVYVGVVNDKTTGGVFQSQDGGIHWEQQSAGLGGRDVFSLATLPDGTLLAGTAHGIFRLQDGTWTDSSAAAVTNVALPKAPPAHRPAMRPAVRKTAAKGISQKGTAKKVPAKLTHGKSNAKRSHPAPPHSQAALRVKAPAPPPAKPAPPTRLDAAVYVLVPGEGSVYAGTGAGLMRGDADGRTWAPVTTLPVPDARFVSMQGGLLMVAGLKQIALSADDAASWSDVALPAELKQIGAIAVDGEKNLWVGGGEGVYVSSDRGESWKQLPNLFLRQVDSISFDPAGNRVLVTTSGSTIAFAAHLPDRKVSFWDTGWKLRFARPVGDYLIGATLYDGVVVQPRMVDSVENGTAAAAMSASGTPAAVARKQ